jgi:hypothetical protein
MNISLFSPSLFLSPTYLAHETTPSSQPGDHFFEILSFNNRYDKEHPRRA